MGILSLIRPFVNPAKITAISCVKNTRRNMAGAANQFVIEPTRWHWFKFREMLHFYSLLGLVPIGLIITYCNVFIGPAQIAEIPEGYVPYEYEYHRHPISRFLAWVNPYSLQMNYEMNLHVLWCKFERCKMGSIEQEVKRVIRSRDDTQAYTYGTYETESLKVYREFQESKIHYASKADP